MLKAGQKLWNGAIVSPQLAKTYNAQQDKIAAYEKAGLPIPENVLNGAHSLLNFEPIKES